MFGGSDPPPKASDASLPNPPQLKQWALHVVMLTAFVFIITCGVIVGISKVWP